MTTYKNTNVKVDAAELRKNITVQCTKLAFSDSVNKQDGQDDAKILTISGHGAVFGNIDRQRDVIKEGAFRESIEKGGVKSLLLMHNSRDIPLGVITELREDDKGLFFKAVLPLDDVLVRDRIAPQVRIGSLDKLSIGFNILEANFAKGEDGQDIQEITKIELFEISLVSVPANPKARLVSVKSMIENTKFAPRDTAWNKDDAIKRIREFTNSTDKPSEDYAKAFAFVDNESPEDFDSYLLPIMDVVDGKMLLIREAAFNAASILSGAKGGVDLTKKQRESTISVINDLYVKMDNEFTEEYLSPFAEGGALSKDETKYFRESDLVELMYKKIGLTKSAARAIVQKKPHSVRTQPKGQTDVLAKSRDDNGKNEHLDNLAKQLTDLDINLSQMVTRTGCKKHSQTNKLQKLLMELPHQLE